MYCSRTLTPSGGRAEQLRGGALGAMPTTKKVLTRAEAKAMALRDGVEQVVLTQDVDDMQRVANERKERAEEARRRLRSSRRKGGEARQGCKNEPRGTIAHELYWLIPNTILQLIGLLDIFQFFQE